MAIYDDYLRHGLVVISGFMSAILGPNGYKKKFAFPPEWQKITQSKFNSKQPGHILRTGEDVGIFAIDIDDPELQHNMELMDLMVGCNMKQKTTHGYHYVYKWDQRVKTTTSVDLKLDIRSDNACIFCEPSWIKDPEGNDVGKWTWLRLPEEEEEISTVPEEVIEFLSRYGDTYINKPSQCVGEGEEKEVGEEDLQEDPEQSEATVLLKVMDGLSTKRYDNYDSWLKIGMVCYNEGLPLPFWDACSQRSDNYQSGACGKKWLSFKEKGKLTEATLWYWLKQDNPKLYCELMEQRESVWSLIELLNHNDIAKYFYSCNSDSYLWNDKLGWFSLQWNNSWKRSENGQPNGLKSKISDALQIFFKDIKTAELMKYAKISSEVTDRDKQDKLLKEHASKIRMISKAYIDLGKSDFCNGVISFLQSLYAVDNLEQIMDMNINLMAFTDGVFDCSVCKFRAISPKDYISITTGYPYPKRGDPEVRAALRQMIHGMFECDETEHHLLRVLASCLYGNNRWEQFYVLTGKGGNGKGMINTLLRRVFGAYHYEVPMTLFTKVSEKKEQPMPELVEARNKRVLMASESEKQDILQIGFLKGISGNDIISARTLYSGHIHKYIAPFKLILQCNTIPKLSKLDDAIKRRMIVIDFPFQFRESSKMEDGTEPHMNRLQNPDMKIACNDREDWRDEFLLMLTEIYSEIREWKELPVPAKVREATQEYLDTNNPLKDWLAEFYEITKNEADFILSSELKKNFHYDTRIEKMAEETFKDLMTMSGVQNKRMTKGKGFFGLKRRIMIREESDV